MAKQRRARWIYPNLRSHRERIGWTQQELCSESEASISSIQTLENGGSITRRVIIKIFEAISSNYKTNLVEDDEVIEDTEEDG